MIIIIFSQLKAENLEKRAVNLLLMRKIAISTSKCLRFNTDFTKALIQGYSD